MSCLVGDNGVQLSVRERCLINREMRAEVVGEQEPLFGVFFLCPLFEVAQMIFVLFFKFLRLETVRSRDRREGRRGFVRLRLLKNRQTRSRVSCQGR